MKNTLLMITALIWIGFSACSKSKTDQAACTGGATTFQGNEPFFLCYGTSAKGQDGNITLKVQFDEVFEDSRCPNDVVCVWQGRVDVGISCTIGNFTTSDTLRLGGLDGPPTSDSTIFQGYKIKLLKVDPYPEMAGTTIPAEDYKIRLLVSPE